MAGAEPVVGLLLDLDFTRTPPDRLCDEMGGSAAALSTDERRRLAQTQGILVLRALRARGTRLPALLFADLDDAEQCAFLERWLAPLEIVPSTESLSGIARRLRRLRRLRGSVDRTER